MLPPGASVCRHLHREVGEVYCVIKDSGTITGGAGGGRGGAPDTAAIKEGDAIPLQLGEVHLPVNTA